MPEESESNGNVNPSSGNSLAATRAVPEFGGDWLAALGAGAGRPVLERTHMWMAGLVEDTSAAVAFQEGLPPLDGNQGNEEKTDIVVKTLEPGRRQAASGTGPSLVIHLNFLRLYPPDKKEEDPPPGPIPAVQGIF
jgi:hypothetical protein